MMKRISFPFDTSSDDYIDILILLDLESLVFWLANDVLSILIFFFIFCAYARSIFLLA